MTSAKLSDGEVLNFYLGRAIPVQPIDDLRLVKGFAPSRSKQVMNNENLAELIGQLTRAADQNHRIRLINQYFQRHRFCKKQQLKYGLKSFTHQHQIRFFIEQHLDPFQCLYCDSKIRSMQMLNHHVRVKHPSLVDFWFQVDQAVYRQKPQLVLQNL